jgi:hypothetical protein
MEHGRQLKELNNLEILKINQINFFNPHSLYFGSVGLSPNPSPEVGGAFKKDSHFAGSIRMNSTLLTFIVKI